MAVLDGLQPDAKASANSVNVPTAAQMDQMSYAEQYDHLASQPKGSVNFKKPCQKPSLEAQVHVLRDLRCAQGQSANVCLHCHGAKL